MRFGRIICMSAIATCIAFSALAQGLPKANKPEDVGFSSERLKRVTDAFQSEVDKGAIPGGRGFDRPQWENCILRNVWISKSREQRADEDRCNFPDCIDEQTDHFRSSNDVG